MQKIDQLKPKVKQLAEQLIASCKEEGITIKITNAYRSSAEQNALYAQGRTKKGKIVTNAKGGQSFHNYGVAFDFVPIIKGKAAWKDEELFRKVGKIGESLGLEWGGSWKGFLDLPHFQCTLGYTIAQFKNEEIDETLFVL